ncbi:EAL domain-containing protein, partial [Shewanella algae]|uniref:EAL domain-containing protein n=1 Tax=Shewanella algae TaxID=38313 RepID=UPI003006B7B4
GSGYNTMISHLGLIRTFLDYIYQLKNQAQVKVIVEKVETLEQFLAMELVPYDGLQGYLFSQPEKLAQIELHRHAFG